MFLTAVNNKIIILTTVKYETSTFTTVIYFDNCKIQDFYLILDNRCIYVLERTVILTGKESFGRSMCSSKQNLKKTTFN